ncbi:MAG: metallophosphoesterase [Mesonia hippocampi]|uniref:metallophosphoesterase n=1 Tax=Mesonia hippocampi TaxID=1628250 RepID=UPI003F9D28C7
MKNKTIVVLTMVLYAVITMPIYAQNFPEKFSLTEEGSFSMILLPDTQNYAKFDINQPLFTLMTKWIAGNIDHLNIKAVISTGDQVEHNDFFLKERENGNQTSKQQWEAISESYKELDNKVPYVLSVGNHDYGYKSAENRNTNFDKYFNVERNPLIKQHLVDVYTNIDGKPTLENAAYEFDLPNWDPILIVSLEFAPRSEVLDWAKKLVENKAYDNHKVFLLTHSYLKWDGSIIESENYKLEPANYGKAIFDRLIKPSKNIRFLMCGHYCLVDDFEHNVGQRTDKNAAGKEVFQMLFNAQTAGGGWHGNGGDGWLRLLEFLPDGKTIKVKTYSPLFGISPTTQKFAWRTEPFDQFDIILD